MTFIALQENLRRELHQRIEAGELTGMELARRAGFTQAHISNFLNRKRGLKLSALDRVLRAIGFSLYDLLDPHELGRFAAVPAGHADFAEVPLVSAEAAASSEVIVNEEVQQFVRFRRALLNHLRPGVAQPARKSWTRFVAVEVNQRDGVSMAPRLSPGAIALLDRHYISLLPYRKNDRNLYAVRASAGLTLRYIEQSGPSLILRPHHRGYPIEVLALESGHLPSDRIVIVGRVAHIAMEV